MNTARTGAGGRRGAGVLVALTCGWLGGGCVTSNPSAAALALARPVNLQRETLDTGTFLLTSFVRIVDAHRPLFIYIEGDGYAWRSRWEPSSDPTPRHAMALRLAVQDPAVNLVYLARPCQFTAHDPLCEPAYWTGKRFSREVVDSMNQAVSHYASRAPGQRIHLIGYSGGAAVAVLIASIRSDVASIRTIAGNLDTDEVTRLHGVSPMPESVNPLLAARSVAGIPQIHFSGADDPVVPPVIAERFARAGSGGCIQTRRVLGLTHEGDWPARWKILSAEMPRCLP